MYSFELLTIRTKLISNQVNEELSTACSMHNIVLSPTGETKNNVFVLEEFIMLPRTKIFDDKNNKILVSPWL